MHTLDPVIPGLPPATPPATQFLLSWVPNALLYRLHRTCSLAGSLQVAVLMLLSPQCQGPDCEASALSTAQGDVQKAQGTRHGFRGPSLLPELRKGRDTNRPSQVGCWKDLGVSGVHTPSPQGQEQGIALSGVRAAGQGAPEPVAEEVQVKPPRTWQQTPRLVQAPRGSNAAGHPHLRGSGLTPPLPSPSAARGRKPWRKEARAFSRKKPLRSCRHPCARPSRPAGPEGGSRRLGLEPPPQGGRCWVTSGEFFHPAVLVTL